MQHSHHSENEPHAAPAPAGTENPELLCEPLLADEAEFVGPRRDVRGRTLDDALQQDRQVRARKLRRARQVVTGMQFCDAARTLGMQLTRKSWVPLTRFLASLVPQKGEQVFTLLAGLCCCGVPLIYIGAALLGIGVAGTVLGASLWLLATTTRAALDVYLRHLIPW